MEIFVGTDQIQRSLKNPVMTIGNFDGVHTGHQALFERVGGWAERLGGQSVVMTFNPHPLHLLFPGNGPDLLTTHEQKLELIAACGIDVAIVIPFTKEFGQISAHDFVRSILVESIGIKAIVVGYDYRFGRGRQGNIDFLTQMGGKFGFEVDVVTEFRLGETVVSSTAIRQLIKQGNMAEAKRLLGRPYEITGEVIYGRQRGGRLMGFPTANICMPRLAPPRPGVYVVEVEWRGKLYGGAANLGYNPTFGDMPLSLEVHILDFDQDIYGQTLTVRFLDRLRDEKRFSGPEELTAQIRKDVAKAREILAGQCA